MTKVEGERSMKNPVRLSCFCCPRYKADSKILHTQENPRDRVGDRAAEIQRDVGAAKKMKDDHQMETSHPASMDSKSTEIDDLDLDTYGENPPIRNAIDHISELVPDSLADMLPIIRAAQEAEAISPRIAHLCRFYALDKAHHQNPNSVGKGVSWFKSVLLLRLERDDEPTLKTRVHRTDALEMRSFYELFKEMSARALKIARDNGDADQAAEVYEAAAVYSEVLQYLNNGLRLVG